MTTTATPNATEFAEAAQEQTVSAIRQSQQFVVEAVRTWAETVEKAIPAAPIMPFAKELPTPQQLIDSSFGFAEELLKVQREFAEQVIAAATPAHKTKSSKPV